MSMMIPDMVSGVARPLTATAGVKAAPEVQQPEAEAFPHSRAPVMDEYIPEEKQEPSGRYWLGWDEDGRPKICFDDPERADDEPSPAKKGRAERCTANTDRVDREIERLRRRKETLEQQISAQTDGAKIRELERKLAQAERELAQKDNDAYRRQHAVFS